MIWEDHDAELLRLKALGMTNRAVGKHFGVSRNAIAGRLLRLRERERLAAEGIEPVKLRPPIRRLYDTKQMHRPCKAPFEPDDSVPDFAWDDAHCAAVMAAGGFPVLQRRAA